MAKHPPAKKKKPSTALATRPKKNPQTALMRQPPPPPVEVLPPSTVAQRLGLSATLDQGVGIGDLGLIEVTLTEAEERVLAEPVRLEDVRVKPDGAVYLPHSVYARWLTRAFGRTGWTMRPIGLPQIADGKLVQQPFVLLIHGLPVKAAWGEQDYHAGNKNQSYGDAIEATRGNALRRCCKQLAMGLELWDKEGFIEPFLDEHCVKVWVDDKDKPQWRLRTSRPFPGERAAMRDRRADDAGERPAPRDVRVPMHSAEDDKPITDKQRKRFWAIARERQRPEADIRAYLKAKFGIAHTQELKRRDYETACAWLEHPTNRVGAREPGSDDE